MKERYVVYDKKTGYCLNGQYGLVDRSESADGSTFAEHIEMLAEKYGSDAAVAYFPAETVFDPDLHKIVGGAIEVLVQADLNAIEQAQPLYEEDQALKLSDLLNKTPEEIYAYIDANMVDLASAREMFKKMVRVVLALARKMNLST